MRRRGAVVLAMLAAVAIVALLHAGGEVVSEGDAVAGGGAERGGETGSDVGDGIDALLGDADVPYQRTDSRTGGTVREEAEELLRERRDRGDCVLVRAGYLDLLGRTWGCVLHGKGWVEVCIVAEDAAGGGSSVGIWRMSAGDVSRELGSAGRNRASPP